ncbi:g5645 [Coccomyxa elongata]
MALQVTFKGRKHTLPWTQDLHTLQDVAILLANELSLEPDRQKFLTGGRQIVPSADPGQSVHDAGLRAGSKILLIPKASPEEVAQIQAVPDQRIRGFDDEILNAMRRRQTQPGSTKVPSGPYTFQLYEAWNRSDLQPEPSKALKLLHRLAADRGIVGIMAQHRWTVGALTEMPPEGKVGVSPVCILGVNINKGQEISLRLRTDDLKGFRRYDRIRETLVHELAHMVWGEHDANFKELNSQLLREARAHDVPGAARSLAGGTIAASFSSDSTFVDPSDVMAVTFQQSGKRLGGHSMDASMDARTAAALSALRRTGQAGGPSGTQSTALANAEGIDGLGHHDDRTEKLEQEMRALGSPRGPADSNKSNHS